jgi:hypothetical protein
VCLTIPRARVLRRTPFLNFNVFFVALVRGVLRLRQEVSKL